MTAPAKTSTFRAALIQMRSARSPQANVDAAAKLIGEAKNAGADYVLTPEMTNGMAFEEQLAFATVIAPKLTIQGGTTEVLRGIIARGLGLR